MKAKKMKKLNSKGFTLIELLIVIIIIGILAAIAFIAYSGSQNKAHKADAQSTLGEVRNKLGEYNANHSSYPATLGDADNWINSSEGGNNATLAGKFTAANSYTYSVTPSGCGDTVASGGAITAGTTACTGYSLTAAATIWGDSNAADNITVTN
ncbi:MAG TPA: prepilin-type N-terminal cleavage/methylation domain-containing protein [Candidatus Dormibacteraeota bacterium]|nr:prepilin-type N-terminal cleavage/methylation domain-containing protein [Candidatus Dormibacteraeota bacterium]